MDNDEREEPEPRDVLVDNLNKEIEERDEEIEAYQGVLQKWKEHSEKLKASNSRMSDSIAKYNAELPEKQAKRAAITAELEDTKKALAQARVQIQILQATIAESEKNASKETIALRSKYDEDVAKIAKLEDLLDEERAKVDLYTDLKKLVPELKRCLLANSTNQDMKEISEKAQSSAMIQEQKESKVRATKSALEHTESNLIPESIIPDSEENAIEPDDTRATPKQSESNIIPDIEVNTPNAIKSKSKSRSKAKTAPEKRTGPEVIKSSLKSKPFKITDRMGRILKFLKTNPRSSNADISKGLNISTGDISKLLRSLTSEGMTTRNEDGQYYLGKQ